MHWLRSLLLALMLAAPVAAEAQTYTFSRGYYWSNGLAYTRCWCYQPTLGRYDWSYKQVASAATTLPTPSTPGWRDKLVDIVAKQKAWDNAAKAKALEHNEYLESLEALGLNNALAGGGYSTRYATGGSLAASFSQGFVATQGQSGGLYGYQAAASSYPGVNLGEVFRQAATLTQNAQDLGGQANTNFTAALNNAAGGQQRIAEILARSQAANALQAGAANLAQATGAGVPTPQSTASVSVSVGPNAGAAAPSTASPSAVAATADAARVAAVMKKACASCHGGNGTNGAPAYDLENFASWDRTSQLATVARLTTTDTAKRMPKGSDLAADDLLAIMRAVRSE